MWLVTVVTVGCVLFACDVDCINGNDDDEMMVVMK